MGCALTLPTAASPSRTSLTLLLGLGAEGAAASVMGGAGREGEGGLFARRERPTPWADSLVGALGVARTRGVAARQSWS